MYILACLTVFLAAYLDNALMITVFYKIYLGVRESTA